jgi:serine/threonine protein kinase
MGVVYEAIDLRSSQRVALKALPEFDPAALYGLKQEFRTLADIRHRNLVRLHELVVTEGESVFFTMELVDGVDFLHYVCGSPPPRVDSTSTPTVSGGRLSTRPQADVEHVARQVNYNKLRPALRQLVEGLRTLHEAGKLHRDVKPSNVLVTAEGRVVVLDFGVATDLPRASRGGAHSSGDIVGTPRYMSPEQASGETARAASDLYSVGVLLYEALVGRAPFEGGPFDIMTRKMTLSPPAPSECVEGIPSDLDELCVALLLTDPAKRPRINEVLRILGSSRRTRSDPPRRGAAATLIGRDAEHRALQKAFDDARTGQPITVRVSGEAGMGKSSLVRSFLDDIVAGGQTNVLCGRAYERESVPYKAVDGVIDALSQLLVELDGDGEEYVPRGARRPLARLFPVLLRVPSISKQTGTDDDDPKAERRRAFQGLRECLASLVRRRPLVLFIDDVQWGDADSVALLVEVLRQPGAPGLLLLTTSREDDADASPFLAEMAETWPCEVRAVRVGRLEAPEAHTLALSLIGASFPDPERAARAVVREAHGSPLLIQELVRSYRDGGDGGQTPAAMTLEQVIAERLEALSPQARTLAEVVAVAGRPLPLATFAAASGSTTDLVETWALLEAQGLARTGFRSEHEVAEPVHDRIREMVVALLPAAALREHHRRLATELSARPGADLEALAIHLLGVGETEAAMRAAGRAAEQAIGKLAFEQATRLLHMALDSAPEGSRDAVRLRVRLAETLVSAGRQSAAADEYAKAAAQSTSLERIELECVAAQQLLGAGRIDEGRIALHRVFDAMGLRMPRSALGAVLFLLFDRFLVRLAGLRITDRSPEQVRPEDRVRIETLATLGSLMAVDVILGQCMHAKQLLVAMQRGDRIHILRGLCVEIAQRAIVGGPESKREKAVIETARQLAARIGPEGEWQFQQAIGIGLYMRGLYRQALEKLDFVARMAPGGWAASNARLFACYSCYFAGKYREVARRGPRLLRQVEERGDLYTVVSLRATIMVDIAIANDDPDEARRHVREAMSRWTQSGFHAQHWYALWSETVIELYAGDGAGARARLERDARALRKSLLLQAGMVNALTTYLQGSSAIASIDAAPEARRERVAETRRVARRFGKDTGAWGPTFASIMHAIADNAAGDKESAAGRLREAVRHAEAAGLDPQAWASRYQLGKLIGGDEGRELVVLAERLMHDEGVRSPERTAWLFVPGRWT